jgi:folate-binding protein YgfZ
MSPWHQRLREHGASIEGSVASGFGDPAAELLGARDSAVVCDLTPLAVLRVSGPDAEAFLQGQLTNDVAALAAGSTQYSAWCSPKGRVLANFVLRRVDGATFELLLPEPLLEPVRKRLAMFVLRAKVAIENATAASVRIGVGGPASPRCVESAAGAVPPLHRALPIAGGSVHQLPGARFVAVVDPAQAATVWDQLAANACPAGFAAWRWLTIHAGVPVILPATQDQFLPQAINWDLLGGLSFQKGCYSGQEIVARTQYLGRLKERALLAHAEATAIEPGTRVFSASFGSQSCGMVTNAAPAPGDGTDLLAIVQTSAGANLQLDAPDGPALSLRALPYDLPAAAPPRGRTA